jgi:hypothetical protein
MGRHKKNQSQQQQPNQSGADSDLNAENKDESVNVEIESQPSAESLPKEGFINKIASAADSVGLWDDDQTTTTKKDGRGRPSKTKSQDEFSSIVVIVLTLVLSLSNIPAEVKPNDSEIGVFSKHLTGIMIRHLPISGKLSADGLDIIGMLAIMSTWYARVQPVIKQIQDQKKIERSTPEDSSPVTAHKTEGNNIPVPSAQDWLKAAASVEAAG